MTPDTTRPNPASKPLPTAESASTDGQARALVAAHAAIDKKGENVRILDLRGISGFTDYFVITSAMSERQVTAIAGAIIDALAKEGLKPVSSEGLTDGRWVLIDFGDLIIHIFLDPLRDYYGLETLWGSAPRVVVPSSYYGQAGTRLG
jgi:ribosome-associated protein